MTPSMIICAILIIIGLIFMMASLIGIAVLPDFFTRLHAQGVGDTIGAFFVLAGMMAAAWTGLMPVKILLIFAIIVLTNPIGTNLMMIAAINQEDYLGYRTGRAAGEDAEPEQETPDESEPDAAETEQDTQDETADTCEDSREDISEDLAEDKPEDVPAETAEDKPEEIPEDSAEDKPEDAPDDSAEYKSDAITEEKPQAKPKKKNNRKRNRRRKPSMNMNKAELIKAAEARGISVPAEATKREILDLIYSGKDSKN